MLVPVQRCVCVCADPFSVSARVKVCVFCAKPSIVCARAKVCVFLFCADPSSVCVRAKVCVFLLATSSVCAHVKACVFAKGGCKKNMSPIRVNYFDKKRFFKACSIFYLLFFKKSTFFRQNVKVTKHALKNYFLSKPFLFIVTLV